MILLIINNDYIINDDEMILICNNENINVWNNINNDNDSIIIINE